MTFQNVHVRWPRGAEHTLVTSVKELAQKGVAWASSSQHVYVGMPGPSARKIGLADDQVGPFGKPWACLNDPRGWRYAYAVYLKTRLRDDADFRRAVLSLHGKTLVCWCKGKKGVADPDCHADLLAHEAERLAHDEPAEAPMNPCPNCGHELHLDDTMCPEWYPEENAPACGCQYNRADRAADMPDPAPTHACYAGCAHDWTADDDHGSASDYGPF